MLTHFSLFLAVLAAKFAFIDAYNKPRIGESVITPGDLFNFVVNVGCTGTIISKRHILDAAHCVYDKEKFIKHERYQVMERNFDISIRKEAEKKDYKMGNGSKTKVYLPIKWVQQGFDFAIIEYPEGTNLGVEPVKLAKDYIEKVGDEAYIAGYGLWWENENATSGGSEVLRHTQVTMRDDCFGTLFVCGGNATHRALAGDSGGPMLINRNNQWYQIGVSAGSGAFDYRTRVSSYCNFIEEITKGEAKCESIYPENYLNGQMLPIKHFEPIYKGKDTPLNLFDFVVPLYNYYYNQGCTATVISKRHLLTAAWCVFRNGSSDENNKVHLTEYSSYYSISGKLLPDFRSKSVQSELKNDPIDDVIAYFPLNYVWPWNHNLAVIEFPENVDFGVEPVTLAKDYFQTYLETLIISGFGRYELKNNMHIEGSPPLLQHSTALLDPQPSNMWLVSIKNNQNLKYDEGGPVMVERNGKLYQYGVSFASGTNEGAHTFVSPDCDFIEEVTKKEVTCESALPIYEKPLPESTTIIMPENKPSAAPLIEPSSIAPKMNHFQMAPLLTAAFLVLFCM